MDNNQIDSFTSEEIGVVLYFVNGLLNTIEERKLAFRVDRTPEQNERFQKQVLCLKSARDKFEKFLVVKRPNIN